MRKFLIGCAVVAAVALSPPSEARPPDHFPASMQKNPEGKHETGVASWYGEKFQGRITASGQIYDMNGLTGAHPKLPLGTWVRVTNLQNDRFVLLRINDRGPSFPGRMIDVSKAAAVSLGFLNAGLTTVRVEIVPPASTATPRFREFPAPVAF